MNVPLEDALNPLYEAELQSLISDFPEYATTESREVYTGILMESLKYIKNFMSSFGVIIADFFSQDKTMGNPVGGKSGEKGKGKSKDPPIGQALESPQIKGGKVQGGKGSTNKPKEPSPPSRPRTCSHS